LIKNNQVSFVKYRTDVEISSFFLNRVFNRSSSITKAFILLLAQKNPKNLYNGALVDLESTLSEYNKKEYHHIFPKAFLRNKGVDKEQINCMANFCILPSSPNKKISDSPPSTYFFTQKYLFSPESVFKDEGILESNLLPQEPNIYQQDDYKSFIQRRSELLFEFYETLI